MPTTMPLEIYRGDDHAWHLTLYTDADQTVPDDLTGAAAKAEIRALSGGAVLAALDCAVTLPNVVDVTLPGAATVSLPAGRLKWDLQLTWPDNSRRTALSGPVVVTADVTDSDDLKVNPL